MQQLDIRRELYDFMTPELLRMAGEAIYGPLWQASLARALGITARHMSRLMNPATPDRPGEKYRPALLEMLREKQVQVARAVRILETTDEDGSVIITPRSKDGA